MRYHRLSYFLLLAIVFSACKKGVVTSTSPDSYEEDLSVLRPELETLKATVTEDTTAYTPMSGQISSESLAITEELDKINQIIIQRNSEMKFVDGYTIQIYTGNDDEAARQAKEHVQLMFPELEPVISYNQPTFKVKVGSYHNRLEAHKVFESLKEDFPYALLIPERIAIFK